MFLKDTREKGVTKEEVRKSDLRIHVNLYFTEISVATKSLFECKLRMP